MRAELQIIDLERKMLEALKKAWDSYEQCEGPPPMALVKLMESTHACILKRLRQRVGISVGSIEDLETLAIELAKEQENVRELIESKRIAEGVGIH